MSKAVRFLAVVGLLAVLVPRGTGATVFSSEGYGWWWDEGAPAARGRGGTSVAATEYGAAGAINPSAIAFSELSYGFVSYGGEVNDLRSEEGTYRQRSDLLPQIGGVIALPKGIRLGGMLRVQTEAAFERERRVEDDGPARIVRTAGKGGWNRLQLNLAGTALERRVAWGVGLARVQGNVKEDWLFDFEDPSNRDVRELIEGRLKGSWIGSGGFLVRPDRHFSFGANGSLGGSSRLIQDVTVLRGSSYHATTSGSQELPSQWAVGMRGQPVPQVSLSVDFLRTFWGDAAFRSGPGEPKAYPYGDANQWGIGLEYATEPSSGRPSRTLRAGYYDRTSYIRSADGAKIRERAVTLGFREPVGRRRAAIDLAFEVGRRGERKTLGVEERFVRILAGVSFSSVVREY